jgi:hypothetical protein
MTNEKLTLIDLKKKLKATKERKRLLCKENVSLAKDIITLLKNTIRSCDFVDEVKWSQYTPYYNDGEECTFRISDICYKFSDKSKAFLGDTTIYSAGYVPSWDLDKFLELSRDIVNDNSVQEVQKVCQEILSIHDLLHSLEMEIKEQFGDHCCVFVTKKGIEIEQIDHE